MLDLSPNNGVEPIAGFGLGLRTVHYEAVLRDRPKLDWFEVISENYLVGGGKPLDYLMRIRALYPMAMHGVSLSIGSIDPLNIDYLRDLKQLATRVQPAWLSDHLCWTGCDGVNLHDLMPLPYTEEALAHVVERVNRVQDYLGRRILIENVSSYVEYAHSAMPEWTFLSELTRRSGCALLLDVNNVYVSACNHGFDADTFIDSMPIEPVLQIHIAGHSHDNALTIDTHDHDVPDAVWDLYAHTLRRFGAVATMIERDDHIPPLDELMAELSRARSIAADAVHLAAAD